MINYKIKIFMTAHDWLKIIELTEDYNPAMSSLIVKYGELLLSEALKNNDKFKNMFALYPDSVGMDLAFENKVIAYFEVEEHAHKFGRSLWGNKYIVKKM